MNRRDFLKTTAVVAIPLLIPGIVQAEPVIESEFYPTGLPTLDSLLGGGIPKGSLGLVIGTQGSGKSRLLRKVLLTNQRGTLYEDPLYGFPCVIFDNSLWIGERGSIDAPECMCNSSVIEGVQQTKDFVLATNTAAILTMPVNRSPKKHHSLEYCCSVESYDYFRYYDFIINMSYKNEGFWLNLRKNRWGKTGKFQVFIKNSIMTEGNSYE